MNTRSHLRLCSTLLALALAGCSTEVAISPKGAPVADSSYNMVTGNRTLTGDVKGDLNTIFHAANRALDGAGYLRVKENISKKDEMIIWARGVMDVLVTVEIMPSKNAGMSSVSVTLDNGSQPEAQAIFAAIIGQVNNPSGTEAVRGRLGGS